MLLGAVSAAAPRFASAGASRAVDFEPVFTGGIGSFDSTLLGDHVFRNEPSWCAFWSEAFSDVSRLPRALMWTFAKAW
jgi:hypothetical protein